MAEAVTLRLIVSLETLTLSGPNGVLRSIALPKLPRDKAFKNDIASLEKHSGSLPSDDLMKVAQRLGMRLFELTLANKQFEEIYRPILDSGEGLRLVLEFALDKQGDDSLVSKWAVLPWEFLRDPKAGDFLLERGDFCLLRRLGAAVPAVNVTLPLKVLAIFAAPWNQAYYNRDEALRFMTGELSTGQIHVKVEPQPTFDALKQALSDYKPDVLHIVAHGSYNTDEGGRLVLEDAYGGTDRIPADEFARQFRGSSVKLVALSSCQSGDGEGILGFRGVAQALLRVGVPAVVSMQYEVPIETAHHFSGALYHNLSNGVSLDQATSIARRRLISHALSDFDWAIPAVYVESDEWNMVTTDDQQPGWSNVEAVRLTPHNLRALSHLRASRLFGRAAKMIEVATALRVPLEQRRFVTVTGMGGIGKSAVVIESAFWHLEREYFPDGVFGILGKDISYPQLLSSLGNTLGIGEFSKLAQLEQEDLLLSCLERQRILLVIDNVDGLRDDTAFRSLLARITPNPAGRLLLTCRRRLNIDGERAVSLLKLPPDAAVSLFLHGWEVENLTPEQEKQVIEICGNNLLAGHPLAVVIAASLANRERLGNLTSLIDRLKKSLTETLKDKETPDQERSIVASLDVSYQALGTAAKKLLPLLAVFVGPFRDESVGAMAGSLKGWKQALTELMEHNLVDRFEAETTGGDKVVVFSLHPVVRSYGLNMVEDKKALYLRAGRFLVTTNFVHEIVEGVKHLQSGEAWEEVIEAVLKIERYLDRTGHWAEEEIVLLLGLRAAKASANREQEGVFLGELGSNQGRRGNAFGAIKYLDQALTLSRKIGDKKGEGTRLGNLANAYLLLSETEKAIEYSEQALKISRELKERNLEASTLGSLGNEYASLGQTKKAIGYFEQALVIAREIGDRKGEAIHLGNLGLASDELGDLQAAIGYHEHSLAISREIGERSSEGTDMGNLGSVYFELGEIPKAMEYYEQALVILREIGDRRGEGSSIGNLANTYLMAGDVAKALKYYEQAIEITREIGDRRGEENHQSNLGNSYLVLGEIPKAIRCYEQALAITRQIGDKVRERNKLAKLGVVYASLGEDEIGLKYLLSGLDVLQGVESPDAEKILDNIAELQKKLGEQEFKILLDRVNKELGTNISFESPR